MIILELLGGMGNQMFTYAFGRAFAERSRIELRLDIKGLQSDFFPGNKERRFSLDAFELEYRLVEDCDLTYLDTRSGQFVNRINRRLVTSGLRPFHTVSLFGYFQSEKFFRGYEHLIRKAYTFRPLQTEAALKTAECIERSPAAVAVHIRRGDYVGHPIHQVCAEDYYVRAMDHVRSHVDNAEFFVFSDDTQWCRSHIPGTYTLVHESLSEAESMHLMTRCRHNIISNSSFSWWGAWLGDPDRRLVVAPDRWFNDERRNYRQMVVDGIVPQRWTRIAATQ